MAREAVLEIFWFRALGWMMFVVQVVEALGYIAEAFMPNSGERWQRAARAAFVHGVGAWWIWVALHLA